MVIEILSLFSQNLPYLFGYFDAIQIAIFLKIVSFLFAQTNIIKRKEF